MNTPWVVRQAIILINRGEPLGLPEWAEVTVACRDAAGHGSDGVVELAAAVSRVVVFNNRPHPLADSLRGWPDARPDQVRVVLAMATHAARRGEQAAPWDGLLAGVERAALAPEPAAGVTDLDSALTRWPGVVAEVARGATRPLAAAIGQQQIGLLGITRDLVARLDPEVSSQIDTGRLLSALDASRDMWQYTVTGWRKAGGSMPARAHATAVSLVAEQLRDALLSRPPSAATLGSLVRSGVGGNLIIAAALAPDPDGVITLTAEALDALTTRVVDDSPLLALSAPAPGMNVKAEVSSPSSAPTEQSRPRVAAPAAPVTAAPPAVDVVALTPDVERELAARRDAGVVAAAALEGVPAARALLSAASDGELARLAWEGRQAVGVLVASVQAAIWSRVHRHTFDVDERFAGAALAVAQAAHTWDPSKARWLTYAIKVSDWSLAEHYRKQPRVPLPFRMDIETRAEAAVTPGALDPGRLRSDLPDPGDTAATTVDGARAAALIQRLPWPDNKILSDAMGFGRSRQPETIETIARRIGKPSSTVSAHLQQGLARVRRELGVDR